MDLYQNKYNISFENMLLLKSKMLLNQSWFGNINKITSGIILKLTSQFESKIENYRCLFVFDKSKIVLPKDPHEYNLYLLQYFVQNQQRIHDLKYVLLDANRSSKYETIHEYLEKNIFQSFMEESTENKMNSKGLCCSEILNTIEKMKEFSVYDHSQQKYELFTIYQHNETISYFVIFVVF